MRRPSRKLLAALAGELVAEELNPKDRDTLLRTLHARGWSDRQISEHTRWTPHTVARLRTRLGLTANEQGVA